MRRIIPIFSPCVGTAGLIPRRGSVTPSWRKVATWCSTSGPSPMSRMVPNLRIDRRENGVTDNVNVSRVPGGDAGGRLRVCNFDRPGRGGTGHLHTGAGEHGRAPVVPGREVRNLPTLGALQ